MHGLVRTADANERSSHYRSDIDGLRAIAIAAVVFFHAGLPGFGSGFVGVDIFFVISGFLIGGLIYDAVREGQFSFASFYARRARRILPALVVVIAATLLIGSVLLTAFEFSALASTAAAAVVGVSNISLWKGVSYFAPDAKFDPLLMTWSLGVEEQFYLLFPCLMLLIARRSRHTIVVILAAVTAFSFALSLWATSHRLTAGFYLLPPRAWELGVGAILAVVMAREQNSAGWRPGAGAGREALALVGLSALAVAIAAFDETTPFPGWMALIPVLGTAAVIASEGSILNRKVLSAPPLVFVGLVSYSWYLWHWPLMTYVRISSVLPPPPVALVATALVAFAIACLSWRFVERPFRTTPLAPLPVLTRAGVAIASFLLICGGIKAGHGWPQRETKATGEIEKVVGEFYGTPCLADWGQVQPNASAACVTQIAKAPVVVLIGDSHAAALGPGLRDLAARNGWGSEVLAKSSCRPLLGVTIWRRDHPQLPQECAAFMEAAFLMAKDPLVKTVFLAGMWSTPLTNGPDEYYLPVDGSTGSTGLGLLRTGLANAIDTLTRSGKAVVLVGDSPNWRFNPSSVEITMSIPPRRLMATLATGGLDTSGAGWDAIALPAPGVDPLLHMLAREPGVHYLDLLSRFCGAGRCSFQIGHTLLFADASHVTTAGAKYALDDTSLFANAVAPSAMGAPIETVASPLTAP